MKIIECHSNPYRLRYKYQCLNKYDEQLFCFVKIWNQNNFAHRKKLKNNFFFCLHVLSLKTKNFIKKKNVFNVNQHYNKNRISAIRQINTILFFFVQDK